MARDPEAAQQHPEWMHCPQHHEWLRRFPDYRGTHPAVVAPYIGLNTQAAFQYALAKTQRKIEAAGWARAGLAGGHSGAADGLRVRQSLPVAVGTTPPAPKLASTPYDRPEVLFPLEFYTALAASAGYEHRSRPVSGVRTVHRSRRRADPDGPEGTDSVPGHSLRRHLHAPVFSQASRRVSQTTERIGLLLMVDALEKNHAVFGPPRRWAARAHRHYGTDLIACVEPQDADRFEHALDPDERAAGLPACCSPARLSGRSAPDHVRLLPAGALEFGAACSAVCSTESLSQKRTCSTICRMVV